MRVRDDTSRYSLRHVGLLLTAAATVAVGGGVPQATQAGTLTANLIVTATVTGTGACSKISASVLSFGNVGSTSATTGVSTISVTCNSGTPYNITANGSMPLCINNAIYNIMPPLGAGNTINTPGYQLFKDTAHTLPIQPPSVGNGCSTTYNSIAGTGTGVAQAQTIYGLINATIPGNTASTAAGSYSDTAVVTLTF